MTEDPRFSSLGRLLGQDSLARLHASHVAVIGIGGVGSWAAEALARSGVGRLTLVDMDDVCVTNINRQIHALSSTVGHAKTEALAGRIADIHPGCVVESVYEFLTPSNASDLIHAGFDYVFDATDRMSVKAAILQRAAEVAVPTITAGSAGGKTDPGRIRCVDFGAVGRDDLLRLVRRKLRREHGWTRGEGNWYGVKAIVSEEAPRFPWPDGSVRDTAPDAGNLRMDCATGFGAAVFVTGIFGLMAAGEIVRDLASGALQLPRPLETTG